MKEILIVSGKGGTGKTSFTSSFLYLAGNCVASDYDVDASNLPILLKPSQQSSFIFSAAQTASIDAELCLECGLCEELCRFDAIHESQVIPLFCEGCGFCSHICPVDAISMHARSSGTCFSGTSMLNGESIPLFFAELRPGEENSGKLVAQVKSAARKKAEQENIDLLIADGPPGIGCPVISSLVGVNLAVMVAEPSLSGSHDVKRLYELLQSRGVKTALIINKFDLNPENAGQMEHWAQEQGIPCVGRVTFNTTLADAVAAGEIPASRKEVYNIMFPIWQRIIELL